MSAAAMAKRDDERHHLRRTILGGLPDLVRETGSKRAAAFAMGVGHRWLQELERGWPRAQALGLLRDAASVAEAARVRARHIQRAGAAREIALALRQAAEEHDAAVERAVAAGKVLRWRPRRGARACPKPRGVL